MTCSLSRFWYFSILVIASFLFLSIGSLVSNPAIAMSNPPPQEMETPSQNNLPPSIADAVLQNASQRSGIPVANLEIVEAEPQTWPNGCLGLAEPGEICTAALVDGWRVFVSDGNQTWVYRTGNPQMGGIRLEAVQAAEK